MNSKSDLAKFILRIQEEVNEEEHRKRSDRAETNIEDGIGMSKIKVSQYFLFIFYLYFLYKTVLVLVSCVVFTKMRFLFLL